MPDLVIERDAGFTSLKQLVCRRGHIVPTALDAPDGLIAHVQPCPKTINQGPPCGLRANWRRSRSEVKTV